jgi:hypothetical protein
LHLLTFSFIFYRTVKEEEEEEEETEIQTVKEEKETL